MSGNNKGKKHPRDAFELEIDRNIADYASIVGSDVLTVLDSE